ncbi:MAG: TIGR04255 family protein [Mycobacterium sp.]|nr:TIGR04255 family protein [Mycobacterium sp.]
MATTPNPFAVQEPGYIPLDPDPLVRTIAQVRFQQLTKFTANEDAVAAAIATALADEYPLIEEGREVSVTLTPGGMTESSTSTRLWRLASADGSWQISFGGTFLSIDTTAYTRRTDFAQRLAAAWDALNTQVQVPFITRLGVRYINQLTDREAHLNRLSELLRPEALGVGIAEDHPGVELMSNISEAQYRFADGGRLMARWGLLPEGVTIDTASQPYGYSTWVLDTDSYQEFTPGSKKPDDITEDVKALSLNGYKFFRWAVTEEFLKEFGGEL